MLQFFSIQIECDEGLCPLKYPGIGNHVLCTYGCLYGKRYFEKRFQVRNLSPRSRQCDEISKTYHLNFSAIEQLNSLNYVT